VLNKEPSCAESGFVTAEIANSVYSELYAGPSNTSTPLEVVPGRNGIAACPVITDKAHPELELHQIVFDDQAEA
jgi:hypothetical protein